jgi:hypothetical protein
MSTDIIKIGLNLAGLGLSIAILGTFARYQLDIPDKLTQGGMFVTVWSMLYKVNNR